MSDSVPLGSLGICDLASIRKSMEPHKPCRVLLNRGVVIFCGPKRDPILENYPFSLNSWNAVLGCDRTRSLFGQTKLKDLCLICDFQAVSVLEISFSK